MSLRRSAKTDNSQTPIIDALRQIGCTVIPTHQLKNAFDCIAFYRGETFVIEIKNPEYLPKKYNRERLEKSLSDGERECMQSIEKAGCNYHIIATVEEAINLVTNGEAKHTR